MRMKVRKWPYLAKAKIRGKKAVRRKKREKKRVMREEVVQKQWLEIKRARKALVAVMRASIPLQKELSHTKWIGVMVIF